MNVEVVCVGSELLLGQIVNSNAADIGARLAAAGLGHYRQSVVGDNLERCAETIAAAIGRADAVIVTGGIGPTQDDITREAISAATGLEMAFSEEYAQRLRDWFDRRGREMPKANLRQAEHPEGSALIINRRGTAPGLRLHHAGTWIFALPGVPAELHALLDEEVIPFLAAEAGGGVVHSRVLKTWGLSESGIATTLGPLFDSLSDNPTMAFLASDGEIRIRLSASAGSVDEAEDVIAPVEQQVRELLGSAVYGADGDTVQAVVLDALADRGWTVATAESATGGRIAAAITDVPGASKAFRGSIVAYSTDTKRELLDVPGEVMAEHGVVSEATARAMARGAAQALGADVAIAVTGAAGPDPNDAEVGTMAYAVVTPDRETVTTLRLPGDRERVRAYATTSGLHLLRRAILGEEGPTWATPKR